jgi:NAD(P)-dependent dehydrogenase (short-subunit alcohol dehydrogenase family)
MNPAPFEDHVVVVTGASSGMGREMAHQLAGQGAWLTLASQDERRLAAVTEVCRRGRGRVLAVPTDVSDPAQCERLIARTVAEYGRLDTLVNNAGITMWTKFDELEDLTILDRLMRVNYLGAAYCTHAAIPHLKKTRGRLVAVSSISGKLGVPYRTGYVASKHAVTGFFDALRIELAEHGVTVTVACPNFVATETHKRAFGADGRPLGESPVQAADVMPADAAARAILAAAAARKREIVMTSKARAGVWLRMIAPGFIDRQALKAIRAGR